MKRDWTKLVEAAIAHLEKGGRIYPTTSSLTVIDDVASGLGPAAIAEKNGFKTDLIETALGHVTTAVHGGGSVPPLASGGWYERKDDAYVVASGFAVAWKEVRGRPTK